nr:DNA-directed RNA polymerase III subunit RPC7-like [Tanacetum cinerariifolium]
MISKFEEYPAVDLQETDKRFKILVSWGNDLQKFWISSSYHLDDARQGAEKNGGLKRHPLSDLMKMADDHVPAELVAKNARHNNKKVRRDPHSDLHRLDLFEKPDQMPQGQDDDSNEKRADEDEDGEEDSENAEEEDKLCECTKNIEFDDDEDEFNPADDGDGSHSFHL